MATTIGNLSVDQQIEAFYIAYYGAAADSEGFAKWESKYAKLLEDNTPSDALVIIGDEIGLSSETKALYPFLNHLPLNPRSAVAMADATTLIDNIYQNLFGHAPPVDSPLVARLINGFLEGTTTISEAARSIVNHATGANLATLENKLTVATDFTTASTAAGLGFTTPPSAGYLAEAAAVVAATTSDPSTVVAQDAAITAYIAQASAVTYTLTTGADDFVGKPGVDSTFVGDLTTFFVNGKGPTLNSDDILVGGSGAGVVNTLIINDSNSAGLDVIPAGAQISNIQDILLQTAGNAGGGAAFDTSGISGVVDVTVNSAGAGADVVKAAAGVAITIDHASSLGSVTTIGGGNINVTSAAGDFTGETGVLIGSDVNAGFDPTGSVDVTATSAAATVRVFGGDNVTVDTAAKNYVGSVDFHNGDYNNFTQVGANYATPSPSEPTGNVTVDDTGDAAVYVFGGVNVNVQSAGGFVQVGSNPDSGYTDSLEDVVGSSSAAVYAPGGTVTVTDAAAQVWGETAGYEEDVEVIGGTTVSVTTNTGAVNVGDDALNAAGTALLAGENPSGNVTIVDTATNTLSYVYVAGGANVGVTSSGGSVYVGDVNTSGLNDVVSAPTGAVTIVDHAAAAWTATTGTGQTIEVIGGTAVSVTTNTASVCIGGDTLDAAGTGLLAGENPSGNVTVVDTATSASSFVHVYGGENVGVTSSGGSVYVGAVNSDNSANSTGLDDVVSAPTGAVTIVDQAPTAWTTGAGQTIDVLGGTTVSVTTNTASVYVGGEADDMTQCDATVPAINAAGTGFVAGQEPTGDVTVTDTATAAGAQIDVFGGANVTVTASGDDVNVGALVLTGDEVSNDGNCDDDIAAVNGIVSAPTGAVTVTNTAATAYDGVNNVYNESVNVIGGTTVNVTTNAGSVYIGDDVLDAAGTGLLAGENPSGNVTVVDTATSASSSVHVYGGENVGVTTSGGSVYVGAVNTDNSANSTGLDDVVSAPTGTVTIVDQAVSTWTGGAGQTIDVFGGTTVSVTTNTASVYVGGDADDMTQCDATVPAINAAGTGFVAGQEPTGDVTVTDTATAAGAQIDVFGGANVTVTASGDDVNVGALVLTGDEVSNNGNCDDDIAAANDIVSAPTGAVTVTNTAATAYDGIVNDYNESVNVIGGTTVNVTTNSGNVDIGSYTGAVGSEASGDITIVDTATSLETGIWAYGGADVNITASAGSFWVGDGTAATNATGSVTINQSGVDTGYQYDNFIYVNGAGEGANVTINTTGAGFFGPGPGILVGDDVGYGLTPVTGAVLINDTYSGLQHDNIAVYGGTTVTINDTVSSENYIDVGASPMLSDGTALANGADDPTGSVVINDSSTFGATTYYGSERFEVTTDGSTSVSVTGGAGCDNTITDAQATIQTEGVNAGQAVGVSTLSSVSLDGVAGVTTITSDALTSLSLANADMLDAVVVNNTAGSALTVNLASDPFVEVAQGDSTGYIASVTVTATGTASDVLLDTPDATLLTFDNAAAVTLDECSDLTDVVMIRATGSGELTLGDLTEPPNYLPDLTSINAHDDTGGVLVEIDDATTSFTGGAGDDVVSITQNALGGGITLTGGGGVNTLYANFAANVDDVALGDTAGVHGFQNFGVVGHAEGTYNAEGFQQLIVGAYNPYAQNYQGVAGAIDFTDVAQGATLDLIAPSCEVTYALQSAYSSGGALNITDGVDTTNGVAGTQGSTVMVDAALTSAEDPLDSGITTLNIDSQGAGGGNILAVDAPDVATIRVTGDEALTLATDSVASLIKAGGSSGTVDVTGVGLAAAGVTVTGGSGLIMAQGYVATDITSSIDVFNVGSGGGIITLGAGGAGYDAQTGSSTGSETVNLNATAPVGTTIVAGSDVAATEDGSFGVVHGWTHGTIDSGQTADSIVLTGTPVVIANASEVVETRGKFDVSDGVITLAADSPSVSNLQELAGAQAIVDAGGVGAVGMITIRVASGLDTTALATFVIQDNGGGAADTFVELVGVSGVTGFGGVVAAEAPAFAGNVGAGTSVMLGGFNGYDAAFANVTADNGGSASANETFNDAGYTIDDMTASGAGFTNTFHKLANFGILQADTTGDGNVVVTQVGIDPVLALTAFGDVEINNLTYGNAAIANDDPLLTLYADGGSIDITGQLIDASNTGTALVITGGEDVTIAGTSDTALTTINASTLGADLVLTANQNGLSIVGATADGDTIVANGNGDNISVGSDSVAASTSGDIEITANGAGDTISVVGGEFDGTPAHGINAGGAGDTITEAGACGVVEISSNGAALGANDTINVGDASVGHGDAYVIVGANSTVNIVGSGSCAVVNVENVATGATSSGSYAFTTISGVHGHDLTLDIGNASMVNSWAGCFSHASQVNVATATSLANALDIAANQAAVLDQQFGGGAHSQVVGGVLELDGHSGLADWFQYGGNTYIVEAINTGSASAAHAGLGVNDEVVKLTGLVDANHIHMDFAAPV